METNCYKFCLFYSHRLEDHVVGLVVVGEGEFGTQVCLKHGGSLNNLQQSSINFLLVSLALVRNNSSLGSISCEELLFVARLDACKVSIGDGGNINRSNIYAGGGSDNVSRAYTTKRNTVDLVRSRDEDKSRLEYLKSNNTLSTEASSKKDENGSRCDRCAYLGCGVSLSLTVLKGSLDIISRVVLSRCYRGSSLLGSSGSDYFLFVEGEVKVRCFIPKG